LKRSKVRRANGLVISSPEGLRRSGSEGSKLGSRASIASYSSRTSKKRRKWLW
jgi:hypothetical protein